MLGSSDDQESVFEVWIDNWDAVAVFLACETQWHIIAGMGGVSYQGIQYQTLDLVFRALKIQDISKTFNDLQVMELAALEKLNQRQSK